MTITQKSKISALRQKGESYNNIAEKLNISVNTVKSFCRRNNAPADSVVSKAVCPQCGKQIITVAGRKPKKFCSDECRVAWWNSHQAEVSKKAYYTFKCAACGSDFTAYGNSTRRYCSHKCYCADRFGKAVGV
jgi:endogenous inhibitor of DNA gyrase (YacG/DUF329 family)